MDRKSRCEPNSTDSYWFSNLQLLGMFFIMILMMLTLQDMMSKGPKSPSPPPCLIRGAFKIKKR